MKRLMAIFLTLVCVLSVIGCRPQQPDGRDPASDSAEAGQFSFFYQLEKTAYQAGERIEIKATITNNTGKDYTYTGSYSDIGSIIASIALTTFSFFSPILAAISSVVGSHCFSATSSSRA